MTTYDVLKKAEWQESELGPRCPLCRAYQPRGHREGCEMQAALDRERPGYTATEARRDLAEGLERAAASAQAYRVHVYGVGVANASVCAPSSMPLDEILRQANAQHPAGTAQGWMKSPSETFATGQPNPCACTDTPGRLHFLLEC